MRLLLLAFSCLAIVPAALGQADGYVGSAACAPCHPQIYRSYSATAMARSSGRTADVPPGGFTRSGVLYRIFKENDQWLFEFARGQAPPGRRPLTFFIGSGAAGQSFAFQQSGFLFQAPVSWYSQAGKWDVSPGYDPEARVHLTRPIETECLHCHASRLRPVTGTQNGYEDVPFLENGIGCERCHGPGEKHVALAASGRIEGSPEIVNPGKLPPVRRDSVCALCHLTGEERVLKAGGALEKFRPGDALHDSVVSFVWPAAERSGLRVTSHYEKLWQSGCKKASGDRFWCGTCHDPHSVPPKTERSAYYREKCLACHPDAHRESSGPARAGGDCISCHMPAGEVSDVAHTVFTDHSIPRLASAAKPLRMIPAENMLTPFWGPPATPRDLGLAYLRLANRRQHAEDFTRASRFLKEAEAKSAADPAFLTQLAYLYDREGNPDKALLLYERAFRADPAQTDAAVNLGSLLVKRGRAQEAIQVWEAALEANPGLEAAGMNLALAHIRAGRAAAARAALEKLLEYSPDLAAARKLLAGLDAQPARPP